MITKIKASSMVLICLFFSLLLSAKDYNFSEQDLGVITKIMANILTREHYLKRPVDDKVSENLFKEYFKMLDPGKIYFSKEDISSFSEHRFNLDEEILNGNFKFAFQAYDMMTERIGQFNAFAAKIVADGIDFTKDEAWELDRSDSEWPLNAEERKSLWEKKIKNDILIYKSMMKSSETNPELNKKASEEKLWTASLKPEDRVLKRYSNNFKLFRESEPIDKIEIYLSTLASTYDPYSNYMSPRSMDDFNIQMSLSLTGIGATLSYQDGYTKIVDLVPGGPAEKSGQLHPGDRIIAVTQTGQEPVDVVDMPLSKVVNLIRGEKDSLVTLTVLSGKKGLGAPPFTLDIKREKITLKDQEAQSKIISKSSDGKDYKIGLIKLDSFYFDWNAAEKGSSSPKSSTSDVKKILEGFNAEKVNGVIIDLRFNGGGSLFEAITLTGLFIKDGPVVQIRGRDDNRDVKYDKDGKIFYSGPLIVLVNRMSASASEIFAGAIRDYDRGIVVGDQQTHGKGSVQTIISLNEFLKYWGISEETGSVKITNAKFYRINGASTQRKGVCPDIILPGLTDSMEELGEEHIKNSLEWDCIDTLNVNKYCKEQDFNNIIARLKENSGARIKTDKDFISLARIIEQYNTFKNRKTVSLNEEKRFKADDNDLKMIQEQEKILGAKEENLDSNSSREKINEHKDIQLKESINIITDYLKYLPNAKDNRQLTSKSSE